MNNLTTQYGVSSYKRGYNNDSSALRIPKQFYQSRTSVIKWLPLQQDINTRGIRIFWLFLLTYMQIEHYDISFTRCTQLIKTTQTTLDGDDQKSQKSQDALSIGSSVNIRQRKVSFGLIRPNMMMNNNDQNNKKRRRRENNNMFIIKSEDKDNIEELEIKLKQRQIRLGQLMRRVKILAYSYGKSVDDKIKQQQRRMNNNTSDSNNNTNSSQPTILPSSQLTSMHIAKGLSILFCKQQKMIKQLFQQPSSSLATNRNNIKLLIKILSSQQKDNNKDNQIIHKLIDILLLATKQNILSANNSIKQAIRSNNSQKMDQKKNSLAMNNLLQLLEVFGFIEQKDFKCIYQQQHQQQQASLQFNNSIGKTIGISLLGGFFNVIQNVDDGYLIALDIDRLDTIRSDNVKTIIRQCISSSKHPQQLPILQYQHQQSIQVNNQQQEHNNSNNKQTPPPSKAIITTTPSKAIITTTPSKTIITTTPSKTIITTTPTQFISRYNNRYFKNQRLIYKQKNKLQNRFQQQQLSTNNDHIINSINYNENDYNNSNLNSNNGNICYDNGYQIKLVNVDHSNMMNMNSNNDNNDKPYQTNQQQQNQQPSQMMSELHYEDEINNLLMNSINQSRQQQSPTQQNNQQPPSEQQHQHNSTPYSNSNSTHYNNQQIPLLNFGGITSIIVQQQNRQQQSSRQQQLLISKLYSRQDFQISDNQILDDIERVLI